MGVDIKTAVRTALDFVGEMYAENEDLRDPTLEEVEISSDGTRWEVSVCLGREERTSTMSVVAGGVTPRQRKVLEIDVESGAVLSMKAQAH
jgi:hypothetical protein